MATTGDRIFEYRSCRFLLSVRPVGSDLFLPNVLYERGLEDIERFALPVDADPYASADEAWRHAEQQAVRWVHDRTGDGRGQF